MNNVSYGSKEYLYYAEDSLPFYLHSVRVAIENCTDVRSM